MTIRWKDLGPKMLTKIIILLSLLCGLIFALDESLYVDRSRPAVETHLTAEDFYRGRFVGRSPSVQRAGLATEEETEAALMGRYFEGDIKQVYGRIATGQNIQEIVQDAETMINDGKVRNAVRSKRRQWPTNVVPYTISSQYSSYSRSRIASAMDEYGKQTCIQFTPRNSERDYIYIEPDDGCYSMVGKSGGRQTVSLDSGCVSKGVIIHELMHTVGFFHEQSRNDRDEYVTINYENIERGLRDQFQKYSLRTITHLGTPYDYGSVMHYSSRAFSKNRQPTIEPKQKGARIGQRRGFSSNDINKVNLLYECDGPSGVVTQTQAPINPVNPNTGGHSCADKRDDCNILSGAGWCTKNALYMRQQCQAACSFCNGGSGNNGIPPVNPAGGSCVDDSSLCPNWARAQFCTGSPFSSYLSRKCKRSCNLC